MRFARTFSATTTRRLACAAGLAACLSASADAALRNQYTFNNGNANDSVGGQHGTIVDNTGISKYTGGAIDFSANNGAGSNQNFALPATIGSYVDLPNGLFTGAVNAGTAGAVSLEIWATPQQNRTWSELWSFGTSGGGENSSTGGGGAAYTILVPQRGGTGAVAASTHSETNAEVFADGAAALAVGTRHHVVVTFDVNDTAGGPNGTMKMYVNNAAPVVQPFAAGFLLDLVNDNNNWLGRSQWPDPLFDGTIDEFRVYDSALTNAEVTASFNAGPVPAPLPVLTVNRDTGAISIANQTGGGIPIKGYSISSASGALNPAAWTSIDATNVFDPNGTWTNQSATSLNLAESNTGGTLDGGTLAANSSAGIGAPFRITPFQDLTFSVTLGDNSVANGTVQYTGSAAKRSDLNGDAAVNAADWTLFLPNSGTAFGADTAVAAYLKGDLDGDKDNDYADFKLFKADFVAANGEAAFAALAGVVPEPSTLALAALASFAMVAAVRRREG